MYLINLTGEQVKKALDGMIFYNNLLVTPSKVKRLFIYLMLKVSGNFKEMHGLMVNYKKNIECDDSTKNLYELYHIAEKLAVKLIHEYGDYLDGTARLNDIYNYTFGSQLVERGASI